MNDPKVFASLTFCGSSFHSLNPAYLIELLHTCECIGYLIIWHVTQPKHLIGCCQDQESPQQDILLACETSQHATWFAFSGSVCNT